MADVQLHLGDCLDILPEIPAQSVDAVITDPPYPCIKRKYGYWTVPEWWSLIVEGVVPQVRRILKPTGSAVFILQPNSEHVGQMRGWLWEFMAWVCREWNMVQDVWWWNYCKIPTVGARGDIGLMRISVSACVWAGSPDCYRNQLAVRWTPAKATLAVKSNERCYRANSGRTVNRKRIVDTVMKNGGVTPLNLLPIPVANSVSSAGALGNPGGTPLKLADWWTRYICPPGGTVCDPFCGSGTMGVAAVNNGCNFIGIEKLDKPGYFPTAQERIAEALKQPHQLGMEV